VVAGQPAIFAEAGTGCGVHDALEQEARRRGLLPSGPEEHPAGGVTLDGRQYNSLRVDLALCQRNPCGCGPVLDAIVKDLAKAAQSPEG
jgi:hypothetical protein